MRRLNIRAGFTRRAALVATLASLAAPSQPPSVPGPPLREVAPGVTLFHVTEPALIDPPGPLSVWMLRIDPARTRLELALANDEVVGTETVADTASRHGAVAAINAGFFLPNGDPAGVFKLDGSLISDTRRPRGAVAIASKNGKAELLFDRVMASMSIAVHRSFGRKSVVAVDGVDTTRARGKLMVFTPQYHQHTDTAPRGLEWTVAGQPPRVVSGPFDAGKTPIPPDGFVLSYGGTSAPQPLRAIKRGTRIDLVPRLIPQNGNASAWTTAPDVVGGAGLLARGGRYIEDWRPEQFNAGFAENRHPRTMIGVSTGGDVWLVTVDGRQPTFSAGMTLLELQALARRLDLTDALNLDGGGSTTMWVTGEVVNRPSDATGPRKVSDALLVFPKPL